MNELRHLSIATFLAATTSHLVSYVPFAARASVLLTIPLLIAVPILLGGFIIHYSTQPRGRDPNARGVFARWRDVMEQEQRFRDLVFDLLPFYVKLTWALVIVFGGIGGIIFALAAVDTGPPAFAGNVSAAAMVISAITATYFVWVAAGLSDTSSNEAKPHNKSMHRSG